MWRKFNFFEKATVNDERAVYFFQQAGEFTSSTSGRGHIILGDNRGMIHVLDRSLNVVSFLAYQRRVNHVKLNAKFNCLVTVGDDEVADQAPTGSSNDIVKIYNLDKLNQLARSGNTTSIDQQCFVKAFRLFHKNPAAGGGKSGASGDGSDTPGGIGSATSAALSNLGNVVLGVAARAGAGDASSGSGKVNIPPSPVTCVEVNQDFTCIALGLGSGFIVLIYGDLARGRGYLKLLPGPRLGGSGYPTPIVTPQGKGPTAQYIANLGEMPRITGLGFRKVALGSSSAPTTPNPQTPGYPPANAAANASAGYQQGTSHVLFCVTKQCVFKYHITPKGVEPLQMLDESTGCESGCCTMNNEGDMVVATREGVWFFKVDGKGEAFAFEGKKVQASWFRGYLILVTVDFNRTNNIYQIVTIYDLKNKYIAFRFASDRMQVSHMIQEWGSLFIMAKEQKNESSAPASPVSADSSYSLNFEQVMYLLEEKDTYTKLEMLLQKNLYTTAISLVNNQQLDYSYLVDISRKYGDHLYYKKDYDGAMNQYLYTIGIGRLEPSYVIRKFLDAYYIHNLTMYLEALHKKNLATSDHTTLLLNCYTKLKEKGGNYSESLVSSKLDSFIRTYSALKYDVETAIRVCRQAGYREHALFLAKKHQYHDWYIKILLEDYPELEQSVPVAPLISTSADGTTASPALDASTPAPLPPWQLFGNYKKALRYIESLQFKTTETLMKQYGKALVSRIPLYATNVLIRLCTHYFPIPVFENNRQCLVEISNLKDRMRARVYDVLYKKYKQLYYLLAAASKGGVVMSKPAYSTPVGSAGALSTSAPYKQPIGVGGTGSQGTDLAEGESRVWKLITGGVTQFANKFKDSDARGAKNTAAQQQAIMLEYLEMERERLEKEIYDYKGMLDAIARSSAGSSAPSSSAPQNEGSLLDDIALAGPSTSSAASSSDSNGVNRANAQDFIHCFSSYHYWLMVFLENIIARSPKQPPQPRIIFNTLIELYLQFMNEDKHFDNMYVPKMQESMFKFDAVPPVLANLVDRSSLENSLDEASADSSSSTSSSILQMLDPVDSTYKYLYYDNYEIFSPVPLSSSTGGGYAVYKERTLEILDSMDANYDAEHVLVLVQSMNFKEGILKMYERLGLTHDIVYFYMEQGDYDNVIKACNKFGNLDPNMWIQVLSFFASSAAAAADNAAADSRYDEYLSKILMKIEKDNLLPPLQVVQILAKYRKTKLGTIRDYLIRKFYQEYYLISKDLYVIKEYQQETSKMRQEIQELQTTAKLFQLTTCSLCNSQLELPAIHFMCGHSYHNRCLIDSDMECPLCMKKNREILATKLQFEKSSNQHEQFFRQLSDKKSDGFSVVSEYFGRGIFKPLTYQELEEIDEDFFDSVHEDGVDDLEEEEDEGQEHQVADFDQYLAARAAAAGGSYKDSSYEDHDSFFKNFNMRLQSLKDENAAANAAGGEPNGDEAYDEPAADDHAGASSGAQDQALHDDTHDDHSQRLHDDSDEEGEADDAHHTNGKSGDDGDYSGSDLDI